MVFPTGRGPSGDEAAADVHLPAMRRVFGVVLAVLFAYLAAWGISWFAGDRSHFYFGNVDGHSFASYPGVLFGGLPPIPEHSSDLPPLGAIVGIGGLVVLLIWSVRRRRRISQ
jgi:hypothetical protein